MTGTQAGAVLTKQAKYLLNVTQILYQNWDHRRVCTVTQVSVSRVYPFQILVFQILQINQTLTPSLSCNVISNRIWCCTEA